MILKDALIINTLLLKILVLIPLKKSTNCLYNLYLKLRA